MRWLALVAALTVCSCDTRSTTTSAGHASASENLPLPELRKGTKWTGDQRLFGTWRNRLAYKNKHPVVKAMFKAAKVQFPPRQLLFRAFKKESRLEVWASSARRGPLTKIATYEVCAQSGDLGPKKREGDQQVPEGFYLVDYFNRSSSYYLSMRVNYPNRRDRRLGYTGSLIMVHGNCVSIGCLAMTDERIQELWVIADAARRWRRVTTQVHIFPSRDLKALIDNTSDDDLKAFWSNLREGFDQFESTKRLPRVGSNRTGVYTFAAR